jgi:hypothetical protein
LENYNVDQVTGGDRGGYGPTPKEKEIINMPMIA